MDVNLSNPLSEALSLGHDLLDRLFPDKIAQAKQRADAEAHLLELAQSRFTQTVSAATASDTAQAQINTVEASSTQWFKSCWRPAIGWVGALSLFCYYVPYCLVATAIWSLQCYHSKTLVPRPDLNIADLLGLITSMLGVGTMRSLDKWKGVS